MSITIGTWVIPVIATLTLLGVMCRPYHQSGDWDFGFIFRFFWLVPICVVWVLYLTFCLYLKSRHG